MGNRYSHFTKENARRYGVLGKNSGHLRPGARWEKKIIKEANKRMAVIEKRMKSIASGNAERVAQLVRDQRMPEVMMDVMMDALKDPDVSVSDKSKIMNVVAKLGFDSTQTVIVKSEDTLSDDERKEALKARLAKEKNK